MKENGPVNLVPWGLANLFGLKATDGFVTDVSSLLQPSIDLWHFFAATNCQEVIVDQVTLANGFTGIKTFSELVVPNGELWLVRGWAMSGPLEVAQDGSFIMTPLLVNAATRGVRQLADTLNQSVQSASANWYLAEREQSPFVMVAGDAIKLGVTFVSTADADYEINASLILYRAKL